jgi:hypothetical protein
MSSEIYVPLSEASGGVKTIRCSKCGHAVTYQAAKSPRYETPADKRRAIEKSIESSAKARGVASVISTVGYLVTGIIWMSLRIYQDRFQLDGFTWNTIWHVVSTVFLIGLMMYIINNVVLVLLNSKDGRSPDPMLLDTNPMGVIWRGLGWIGAFGWIIILIVVVPMLLS